MTSLLMKIIICPLIVGLAAFILPNVNYANVYQVIIIGLVLALVGTLMEYMVLGENTITLSTALDFVASTIIIYFGSNFFAGAEVTFFGALITAAVLGAIEHPTHRYLVARGKAEKGAYS